MDGRQADLGLYLDLYARTGPMHHSQSLRHPRRPRELEPCVSASRERARSVDPIADEEKTMALLGAGCLTRGSNRLQRARRFSRRRSPSGCVSSLSCSTSPDAPSRARRDSQAAAVPITPESPGRELSLEKMPSASPEECQIVSMLKVLLGTGISAEQIRDLKAESSKGKAPGLATCSSISSRRGREYQLEDCSFKAWPVAIPETAKHEIAEQFMNILS